MKWASEWVAPTRHQLHNWCQGLSVNQICRALLPPSVCRNWVGANARGLSWLDQLCAPCNAVPLSSTRLYVSYIYVAQCLDLSYARFQLERLANKPEGFSTEFAFMKNFISASENLQAKWSKKKKNKKLNKTVNKKNQKQQGKYAYLGKSKIL